MEKSAFLLILVFGTLYVDGIRVNPSDRLESYLGRFFKSPVRTNDPRCRKDGVFPVPGQCTRYLSCKGGFGQERECPSGFMFDSIRHCVPDGADCGEKRLKGSAHEEIKCESYFGIFQYEADCRKYVICFEGRPFIRDCPPEQVYVPNVGCMEGKECITVPPILATENSAKESKDRDFCKLPPDSGSCDGHFSMHYYNTEAHRCEKFSYGGCGGNWNRFEDKDKCERTCIFRSAGIEFNFIGKTAKTEIHPESTTFSDTQNNAMESWCDVPGLYPHPDDCNRFIECAGGVPVVMRCHGGLHFSSRTRRCEYPCDARCDSDIHCGMESAKCRFEDCFECPEENGKFADEYDCSIYHECKNGVSRIRSCKEGKFFDHRRRQCTRAERASCVFTCEVSNSHYPYPRDCERYIECSDRKPKVKKCPAGEAFYPAKKECLSMSETDCKKNDIFDILMMFSNDDIEQF